MYSEKSKADDVQFILDLIAKIGQEIPAADMNNVNIAGENTEKNKNVKIFLIFIFSLLWRVLMFRDQQWSSSDLPDPHQHWGGQTIQTVGN